jgi:hypothetical protein
MQLLLRDNLPFIAVTIVHQGASISLSDVLIDTGSARTLFSADIVVNIHITPAPDDKLYTIRGVGGTEVVFTRRVDSIQVGECDISNFEIEIGSMDYGFKIDGILGMDFLRQAGSIINLAELSIDFK